MSFCAADLSVLAYANGFTHWHYRTPDPLGQILGPADGANDNAYFAAAGEMLRPGDQITINLVSSGAIGLAQLVVAALPSPARPQLKLLAASESAAQVMIAAA
ncbi:hypothetical protein [Dongia sp.]|uniref:hypothetical protein n=1 Tax=Dongia sp. TaxID=1977262 RepID=UPI0035B0E418